MFIHTKHAKWHSYRIVRHFNLIGTLSIVLLNEPIVTFLLLRDVLVRLVVLVFDEIVEQTGPGFVVVVTAEIVADRFGEVEEHVPRVARYTPD